MKPEKNLKKSYQFRQSFFVVISQLIVLEVIFASINYFMGLFLGVESDAMIYSYFFLTVNLINILLVISIFLKWYYRFTVVSEDDIAIKKGVLFHKTRTFDVHSIRSIRVRQSLIGILFNYGTIEFESPLLKKDPVIRFVPNPNDHAKLIEKQRISHLENKPIGNITPVV